MPVVIAGLDPAIHSVHRGDPPSTDPEWMPVKSIKSGHDDN